MYNWFSVERQRINTLIKLNLLMSRNLGNPCQDSFHQSKSDSTANSLIFALSQEAHGTRNGSYGCLRLVRCALRIWATVNWGYLHRASTGWKIWPDSSFTRSHLIFSLPLHRGNDEPGLVFPFFSGFNIYPYAERDLYSKMSSPSWITTQPYKHALMWRLYRTKI